MLFQSKFLSKQTILLAIALFFSTALITNAAGSSGWLAPKVDYVDSNISASCTPTQASVEIWLVEEGSKQLLLNSIGSWEVITKNKTSKLKTGGEKLNGSKKSSQICFDPVNDGIQVIVNSSVNYRDFTSPTIMPVDLATGDDSLTSMYGNRFKGYVELRATSNPLNSVESVYPNNDIANAVPTFEVKTNSISSLYNSSQVKSTRIYALNQNTAVLYDKLVPTTGGVGTRFASTSLNLPEGFYFWTFHQELNGSSDTSKLTSPARTWNFSNIPASGSPSPLAFTIDTTPPQTLLSNLVVTAIASTTKATTVSITNTVSDLFSGVNTTEVYVKDTSDNSFVMVAKIYPPSITSDSKIFSFTNLIPGKNYEFYAKTLDNAGHQTTSNIISFNVPSNYDFPVVTLFNDSSYTNGVYASTTKSDSTATYKSALLRGVTPAASNTLQIIKYKGCYSTTTTNLNPSVLSDPDIANSSKYVCYDAAVWGTYSDPRFQNNIYFTVPFGTTIYFKMFAKNMVGWGYSTTSSFITPTFVSPFTGNYGIPKIATTTARNITHNEFEAILNITDSGGQIIDRYGICYGLDTATLNAINFQSPAAIDANPNCMQWYWNYSSTPIKNRLYASSTIPAWPSDFFRNSTTTTVSPSTTYKFRNFAVNGFGIASSTSGEVTTSEYNYDLRNSASSPTIDTTGSTFDKNTQTFDKINVTIAAYDYSTTLLSSGLRSINYTIELEVNGVLTDTRTGTIDAQNPASSSIQKTIQFTNLPIDVPIHITTRMNTPDILYPNISPQNTDRIRAADIILRDPDSINLLTTGSDTSSSSALILDPKPTITFTPSLIRVNQNTKLKYSIENVNGAIDCKIYGPSTFGVNGVLLFTHNFVDGTPPPPRIETIVDTGILKNSQIFKFECTDPSSTVYATSTRVNVIGISKEI